MEKTRTLAPGVQYLRDPDSRRRRSLLERFHAAFRGWGYCEVVPPVMDYAESFHAALGRAAAERMYSFVDRDGSLLALRPDITTLVAKVVAASDPERLPLRLWYGGEVFRYQNPKAGQQREFYQVGIELVGGESVEADVEVLMVLLEGLQGAGLESIIIPLGHAGIFGGIAVSLALEEGQAGMLKNRIDHKDSSGIRHLLARVDMPRESREFLTALPHLSGGREILDRARPALQNPRSRQALDRLAAISDMLAAAGVEQFFPIDLGEVRDLDYYTGLIFKVYSRSLGFEIGGGGRYDSLMGKFGRPLPAVGFSVGVERLMAALPAAAAEAEPPADPVRDFGQALELRRRGRTVRMEWKP